MFYPIFKLSQRFSEYFRGFILACKIILCGGKCLAIPKVGRNVIWKYPPHKGVVIGQKFDIGSGSFFDVPKGAKLKIGNRVKLTHSVIIAAANEIIIGDDVMIAEFASLRDSTHGVKKGSLLRYQEIVKGNITIGSDVWIGRNTTILNDVILEDGVIIGANSFCSKNIYEINSIYFGVPARFIKKR